MPDTIPTIFPVEDDANPGQVVWYSLERSPYGVWVSVYKERPTSETIDTDAMLLVKVNFFNNQLATLVWDNKACEMGRDDPFKEIWVDNVQGWTNTVDES